MNQDKQLQQMFNVGREDQKRAAQSLSNLPLTSLNLADIPIGQNPKDYADMIKKYGIMPIDTNIQSSSTVEVLISREIFDLLDHLGDLLAIKTIGSSEYMKLKKLIKSGDPENLIMVANMLNAKIDKDVESRINRNGN